MPSDAVRNPIFARLFERLSRFDLQHGGDEYRRALLAGLTGRVVEVGAGNGLNFALYPGTVTEVVAVEPEPYLRSRALERAASAPVPVRVVDALAYPLPFDDGSFDAGVASLMLCTVPDQARALSEFHRVIAPGGELRFYEHVRAEGERLARWQVRYDRTFWPLVGGGCHTNRDTVAAIDAAGFAIEEMERFDQPMPFFMKVASPHVLGVARRS